jgi:hypothetical protein
LLPSSGALKRRGKAGTLPTQMRITPQKYIKMILLVSDLEST